LKSILEIRAATKSFGGVKALNGVNLTLYQGEIHALLGENGAGKSTLLKSLAGVHSLDSGSITLFGKPFVQGSTRASQDQGVAVIYQEPSLFPDLSLAENVFVGRQPQSGGVVDWSRMNSEAEDLFASLGVTFQVSRTARGLSIADQQIVEIAKALSLKAQVIVMDEPTAALSSKEVDRLFNVARTLKSQGCAVVFVSHRLEEVFALCQRTTVMRDGATVGTAPISDLSQAEIIRMMVGREVSELFPKLPAEIGDVVLEVKNLSSSGQFEGVSFDVRKGEIFGIAGLVGSGRSEVVRAIFGIDRYDRGEVLLGGSRVPHSSPSKAMKLGLALVPEDRRLQGLLMPSPISSNTALTVLENLVRRFVIRKKDESALAKTWAEKLQLKYADIESSVERLSGGNQQKVVLAKWLATQPKVLIVDEPTRGIDVGTKSEVHRLLSQMAQDGLSVVIVSSELPEVLGMSDRILVMREGRQVALLDRHQADPEVVIGYATGALVGK